MVIHNLGFDSFQLSSIIWMLAGKIAINNKTIPQEVSFQVEENKGNIPKPISQTPLMTTNSLCYGNQGGIIRK